MTTKAGKTYKPSGEVNWKAFPLAILGSIALCGALGWVYGWLATLNPIIYLNFLLLAGAVLGGIFSITIFHGMISSRNSLADFLFYIPSSFFLFYGDWVGSAGASILDTYTLGLSVDDMAEVMNGSSGMTVGRFGSSSGLSIGAFLPLFYLVEAVILLGAPYYLFRTTKNYYCEDCKQGMECNNYYFLKEGELNSLKEGSLMELKTQRAYKEDEMKTIEPKTKVYKVAHHNCGKCNDSIVDVEEGAITKDSKGNVEYSKSKAKIFGKYVDDSSAGIFS